MIPFGCSVLAAVIGNPDMDCGDPGTPTDGSRTLNATILDSVVTYTCNVGFMLEGSVTRVCQLNQEWSGELPSCVRKWSDCTLSLSLSLSLSPSPSPSLPPSHLTPYLLLTLMLQLLCVLFYLIRRMLPYLSLVKVLDLKLLTSVSEGLLFDRVT